MVKDPIDQQGDQHGYPHRDHQCPQHPPAKRQRPPFELRNPQRREQLYVQHEHHIGTDGHEVAMGEVGKAQHTVQ
jgi:hypothetical protein